MISPYVESHDFGKLLFMQFFCIFNYIYSKIYWKKKT